MTTVLAIKDRNVYYGGKVVGTVIDAQSGGKGLRVLVEITNPRVKRLVEGGALDVSLTD